VPIGPSRGVSRTRQCRKEILSAQFQGTSLLSDRKLFFRASVRSPSASPRAENAARTEATTVLAARASEAGREEASGTTETEREAAAAILSEFQTICVVVTKRNTISHEAQQYLSS
jgi:hypothetical protein